MATPSIAFRPDIQGLRAIAVGLVVLAHAGVAGLAGGFIGVDVFFVLSGYLITGLLAEERVASGTIRYGRFLARRLRRLLPAMLLMLVVVLAVASIVLTAYEMRMQSRSFPFAATWISNFFFAFGEREYFAALQAEDLFLHTWSLGVEEQFYLAWPWLVLLFFGLQTRDGSATAMRNVVLGALALVFIASLVLSLYLSATMPILSFYMMPSRGWQFALGAMVYIGLHHGPRTAPLPTVVAWSAGALGLALIVGSAHLLHHNLTYPGWYALLPSCGTALVIAAGEATSARGATALLSTRPFVWIGDRSYSIYLWHWPVLILGNTLGISRSAFGVVTLVAISIVLAAASYRWVEYPFWKGRFSSSRPRQVVAWSSLTVVAALAIAVALENRVYGLDTARTAQPEYDPRYDSPKAVYRSGRDCDTAQHSDELVPCPVSGDGGERLAILIGDSIGTQWTPLVSGLYDGADWRTTVLTKSGCAIVDLTYYYHLVGGDYEVCTAWRNSALRYIEETRPDVVVIGSSAYYEFDERDWTEGSARILARLSAAADRVVVIPGTPKLSFDGPSCLEDPWRFAVRLSGGSRECEETRQGGEAAAVAAYLRQAARGYDNVAVLDLGDLVCPEGLCAARSDAGIAVFRDGAHLTVRFVESLIPTVRERWGQP